MDAWMEAGLRVETERDIAEFEKVPVAEWQLPPSVYEAIRKRAARQPDAPAVRYIPDGNALDRTHVWSYAELLAKVTQVANFLHELGIGRGDRVGLLLPNTPDAHACLWAAETVGIACPINYMLEPAQISSILEEAGCKVVIALGPHEDFDIWPKTQAALGAVPAGQVRWVVQAPSSGMVDTVDTVDRVDAAHITEAQSHDPIVRPLAECLAFRGDALSFAPPADPDTVAAFFHTGGTTGAPKLARQTHRNQVVNSWTQALSMSIRPGHVRLCGLPLFHVNGAIANGLTLFMAGACLVLTGIRGYRDAGIMRNFWRLVEQYRASSFAAVPTFLVSLAQIDIAECDISSLEFVRCGTAPLSRQLARDFSALSGVPIIEGYGLTESTSISAMNPRFGEKRVGAVGLRMPYQHWEIRSLDRPTGTWRPCATGELGIVFIQGPNIIPCYTDPVESEKVFSTDGWYNTGDIGRLDADGYLWLTGREKDIIIRGGHNLDPRMIEEALYAHPAVQHAAAIGRPDRYAGEVPIAYVALKPNADVDSELLLRFAAERIPERAAVPKYVKIVREMPLTGVGKIFKPALRADAAFDGYVDALGGMIGAYNMQLRVEEEDGSQCIRLVSTNLSTVHHASVSRFVNDALKTFTLPYSLRFVSDFGDRPIPIAKID